MVCLFESLLPFLCPVPSDHGEPPYAFLGLECLPEWPVGGDFTIAECAIDTIEYEFLEVGSCVEFVELFAKRCEKS